MDAQAWRTLAFSFVLFGGVGVVFVFGRPVLGLNGRRRWSEWLMAAPGAVVAARWRCWRSRSWPSLGVPNIMLIAAAVVAFGPVSGFAYSWIGTMVSSLVGFYLGRAAGAATLERFSGEGVRRFMELVGRNGLFASFIVRLVPSAPFIVVNMATYGVTPMRGSWTSHWGLRSASCPRSCSPRSPAIPSCG